MKTFSHIVDKSLRSFAASGMIAVLTLCGVLAIFCFAPQDARDWDEVRKLDTSDAEAFGVTRPHSSVLVTGILDGNPTRTPDGLVATIEQRRDAPEDGGNRYRETWTTVARVWPPLSLQVNGQRLPMAQVDSIEWGGDLHVTAPSSGSDRTVNGIAKMPAQAMGFKDGDQVTVVGLKGADGSLIPSKIYGGDRASLIRKLGRSVWVSYVSGAAFILMACWIFVRHIRVQAEERPPPASR